MASKAIPYAVLVLRIFALAAGAAFVSYLFFTTSQLLIKNYVFRMWLHSGTYVVSGAVIGAAYCIVQLPLDVYYAFTKKRLIRNSCMSEFDFYADKVVSLILASAVGAGFGAGLELRKFIKVVLPLLASLGGFDNSQLQEAQTKNDDFYDNAIVATGILLAGALCIAVVSVLTSISRTSNPGFFG